MQTASEDIVVLILKKMFDVIGLTYDSTFVKEKDWYTKHSWTKEQETKFTKWLISFIQRRYHFTKQKAIKEASWFILCYGWKSDNIPKET